MDKDIIQLRDISDEQAKEEIKQWLKETDKDPIYNSDIFEELEMPYEQVQRIVNQLCEEGYLKEGDS